MHRAVLDKLRTVVVNWEAVRISGFLFAIVCLWVLMLREGADDGVVVQVTDGTLSSEILITSSDREENPSTTASHQNELAEGNEASILGQSIEKEILKEDRKESVLVGTETQKQDKVDRKETKAVEDIAVQNVQASLGEHESGGPFVAGKGRERSQ